MATRISSLLLLFLLAAFARGQSTTRIPAERKCLAAGNTVIFETRTRKCPCFLHGLFVTASRSFLSAKLYALTPAEYEAWVNLPSPKRAPESRVDLPESNLRAVLPKYLSYGWRTKTIRISEQGDFKVIALVSSETPSRRCVSAAVVLEEKPETCPLRLAPPSRLSGVSTFVVGGTKLDERAEFTGYNALISTTVGNCTGSLISDEWVLTAAHCKVNELATVKIGGTTLSDGESFSIARVINHPLFAGRIRYNAVNILNDIALVRLSQKVRNAKFLQINSNVDGPDPGTIVRATGYGKVTTRAASQSLRMVDIAVLSTNECRNRFRRGGKSTIGNGIRSDVHVCVGRDSLCQEGGVCFGDSGGPIVARMPDGSLVQIGVTSYGDTQCANEGSADVFTRVSHYIEWIQANTDNAAKAVNWKSVNNVASSGQYGNNGGLSVPLWVLITIIVGGVICIVGVGLIVFVLAGRRQTSREQESTNGNDRPPPGGDVEAAEAAYPVATAGYGVPPDNGRQIPPPPPPPRVPQQAPGDPTAPLPVYSASAAAPSGREEDEDRIMEGGLGPRPNQ